MRVWLTIGIVIVFAGVSGGAWWWLSSRSLSLVVDSSAPAETDGALVLVSEGLPQGQEWRQDFTFADMNGDGVLDLITAPPRKSAEPWPHIFLRERGRWAQACPNVARRGFPEQKEYVYGDVAVADFNGDGILDIALAMHETGLRILQGKSKGPCGPWEERHDLPQEMLQLRSRAIVAADMNRDGRPDIVALSESPPMRGKSDTRGVVLLWNDSSGWRSQELLGSEGIYGDDITVGEVNGDGILDIAIGSLIDQRPQFAWLSDGEGWWKAAIEGLPEYTIAWSVQLVDIDGDGRDELVLGAGGAPIRKNAGPRVYRWDGTRWHNLSQGLPQISWVSGVAAADLNGDGRKEIVAAGMYTGIVQVYERQGDGMWRERQKFSLPTTQKLRNYKLRTVSTDDSGRALVVGNFSADKEGKILAWAWR
ncbi:MAG: FG-GAP repeat domain-containing protein [Candidatus Binatia bacterium]